MWKKIHPPPQKGLENKRFGRCEWEGWDPRSPTLLVYPPRGGGSLPVSVYGCWGSKGSRALHAPGQPLEAVGGPLPAIQWLPTEGEEGCHFSLSILLVTSLPFLLSHGGGGAKNQSVRHLGGGKPSQSSPGGRQPLRSTRGPLVGRRVREGRGTPFSRTREGGSGIPPFLGFCLFQWSPSRWASGGEFTVSFGSGCILKCLFSPICN